MKQTMALVDFMANTGTSLIEAIGLIDQLHEMERDGKNLEDASNNLLSAFCREPVKRIEGMRLVESYREYQTRVKREANREYNVRLRERKKSHGARDEREINVRQTRDDCEINVRKKSHQESERSDSSSPSSPTPPISSLSLEERERNIPPVLLRNTAPQGESETKKPTKKTPEIPEDFLRFYSAYPRKVNRPMALRAWHALDPDPETVDKICADVQRRLKEEWGGTEMRFIPHPSTYLNGRRWEDETEVTQHAGRPEPSDEDLFAGMSDEDLAILDRIARDGEHWG